MINVLSKTKYNYKNELLQGAILALLALLVPTFLAKIINVLVPGSFLASHSQLIVGSIVNMALVISALSLKGWKNIFVITMPSISTILGGYVFGTSSVYLSYMIPSIWLGNFVLIYAIKKFHLDKKMNYFTSSLIGIILKVLIIYDAFYIINSFGVFPMKLAGNLKTAMGLTQAITATIGVILGYMIMNIKGVRNEKNN